MKKILSIFLITLMAFATAVYAFDDEQVTLSATETGQTHEFTKPAYFLTLVNDGASSVYINFNGTATTETTSSIALKSGESWSWSFDIAGVAYGIKKFGYKVSGTTATIRVFAITD